MTPTTKRPSSIIKKESCIDKKYQSLEEELLHEIKHYISPLQQDNKTEYMDVYQSHAGLNFITQKWGYVSLRRSKGKKRIR